MKGYGIKQGYQIREDVPGFDDTPFTDEFQKTVYERARQAADEGGFRKIIDLGCGSGFKLVQNFPSYQFVTMGIDRPDTVAFLRKAYPDRFWMDAWLELPCDLLICADMIEHVPDPDALLAFIWKCRPKEVILSTPERFLLQHGTEDGPPRNIHHVREWTKAELAMYLSRAFVILRHEIVDQATQLVEMEPRHVEV